MNFPEHLNISPSSNPRLEKGLDAVFGSSAQQTAIENYGIAGRVWEAAYMLNQYVQDPSDLEFNPPFWRSSQATILELGSGTGITSHCISGRLSPGCDILIATDLPEVCDLLEANLIPSAAPTSSSSLVNVRPLAWGNQEQWFSIVRDLLKGRNGKGFRALTHVICSDLIYFPELLAPLLRTLITVTNPLPNHTPSSSDPITVVISYKIRSLPKETPFWQAFGLWFTYEPVLCKEKHAEAEWTLFGSPDEDTAFIFIAHRRKESLNWKVPLDDRDLLGREGC